MRFPFSTPASAAFKQQGSSKQIARHPQAQQPTLRPLIALSALAFSLFASASAFAAEGKPASLDIFTDSVKAPYVLYMGTPTNWADPVPEKGSLNNGSIKSEVAQVNVAGDGKKVTWTGGTGQIYAQSKSAVDLEEYLDDDGALVFDAIMHSKPEDSVTIRVDCRYPCLGIIEASNIFKSLPLEQKTTIKIPLSCFAKTGAKFSAVNTPFLFYSTARFSMSFANVRWVKGAAKDADARTTCS